MTFNVDSLKSKFEAEVYRGLQALRREHQFEFDYEPESYSYIVEHWYKPDWWVKRKDGSIFFIESKGYWDAADRSKILKVIDQHPGIDIRLLFQRDNKIHKSSQMKYSDWCDKRNIKYSIGTIPVSWFHE